AGRVVVPDTAKVSAISASIETDGPRGAAGRRTEWQSTRRPRWIAGDVDSGGGSRAGIGSGRCLGTGRRCCYQAKSNQHCDDPTESDHDVPFIVREPQTE